MTEFRTIMFIETWSFLMLFNIAVMLDKMSYAVIWLIVTFLFFCLYSYTAFQELRISQRKFIRDINKEIERAERYAITKANGKQK